MRLVFGSPVSSKIIKLSLLVSPLYSIVVTSATYSVMSVCLGMIPNASTVKPIWSCTMCIGEYASIFEFSLYAVNISRVFWLNGLISSRPVSFMLLDTSFPGGRTSSSLHFVVSHIFHGSDHCCKGVANGCRVRERMWWWKVEVQDVIILELWIPNKNKDAFLNVRTRIMIKIGSANRTWWFATTDSSHSSQICSQI